MTITLEDVQALPELTEKTIARAHELAFKAGRWGDDAVSFREWFIGLGLTLPGVDEVCETWKRQAAQTQRDLLKRLSAVLT